MGLEWTLFNDVRLCVDIINKILLKKELKQLTIDEYKEKFTFPVKSLYKKVGFYFQKYSVESVAKEWMDEYELQKHEAELFQDTKAILNFFL